MDEQGLRNLVEQLHKELENTQSVDQKGRDLLRDLDDDIHHLLSRSGADHPSTEQSLFGRLEESISYLEVTHPTLTNTLSKILESLSNAGI
jgi:hypothetical protein